MSKIGTAKYGSDYKKKEFRKLKDGKQIFRILPPIGNLADDGKWSIFYSVHFGYKNSKGEMRTFVSPLVVNRKTKMVEQPDAAFERLETLKAAYKKAKDEGNTAVIEKLLPLVGPKKAMYNLDKNHHVNAIDEQGNLVVLKLRHNAKKALDAKINDLRKENVDPLSVDNGRWFTFTRTGMGLDTTFAVEVLQETLNILNVGAVKRDVVSVLDGEMIKRILKEAANLDELYRSITSEEVARIVKESDLATGKSRAIDEILDAKNNNNSSVAAVEGDSYEEEEQEQETVQVASSVTGGQVTPATTQPIAQVQAQVAQITPLVSVPAQAPAPTVMVQAPITTPPPSIAPQTTAKSIAEMSNDEFLASVGLK